MKEDYRSFRFTENLPKLKEENPGHYFDISWVKNGGRKPIEVYVEPWGTSLYLFPSIFYAVVAESETTDPDPNFRPNYTEVLERGVNLNPLGDFINSIYRQDGIKVWDDVRDESSVFNRLKQPQFRKILEDLSAKTYPNLGSISLGEYERFVREKIIESETRDEVLLLIEYGLVNYDEDGLISLSGTGQRHLLLSIAKDPNLL